MTPVEALQAALAGEHAALHVYGVLGGRVSVSAAPATAAAISSAYAMHRARRDQLRTMVQQLGGDPVAADVSYELAGPSDTTPQIVREARGIEERCAEVYAQAVGATVRAQRQWAIDALVDAAVRSLTFDGEPATFPGLPELS
ncbi:MAG TPA: ferritin-like domain-containing protein [Nocardioidaceae bacterium]|nr:ferritin-like domain-containing protein [Nocardioidaceae bacterium]